MASQYLTWSILTGAKTVEGSLRYLANHALIPVNQIVEESQQWIWNRLRIREMQLYVPLTLGVGISSITAPSGYLAPVRLTIDGRGRLPFRHEKDLSDWYDSTSTLQTGDPSQWTVIGTTIYFNTQLSQALTGRLMYYGQPANLSASNQTNVLTDRFLTILRRVCLAYAYEARSRSAQFKDELQLIEAEIMEINAQDELARMGQVL